MVTVPYAQPIRLILEYATTSDAAQLRCDDPDDVERVLTDIDADYSNRNLCCRNHGVLLVLAPLAGLSLAGQEHGRTIPLPDSGWLGRL